MFLNKIRNIFSVPDTKFASVTNVARAGKRGNICVGNNVSATMCPRLPGPLILFSDVAVAVAVAVFFSSKRELKAAKYEAQKPSTCRATLFRCKFWSMFRVFHLA